MVKRIIAGILAAVLLCLCFGCGQKQGTDADQTTETTKDENIAETNKIEGEGKIAVIVGSEAQDPELYATAKQLSIAYGDALMLLGYSPSYYAVATGLNESALAAARDQQVKALIFAGGVNGTAAAAAAARKEREDLTIIACNPLEGTDALKDSADLILTVDFAVIAKQMVADAKANGAENFIFYTTDRSLKLGAISQLRAELERACKAQKITCKAASCIDVQDEDKTVEEARQYIAEDAQRRMESLGAKTALFSTEWAIQEALVKAAADHGMVVPLSFPLSPIMLASELGMDRSIRESDYAAALSYLETCLTGNGTAGRVYTWSFSAPIVFLQAAVDYACDVLNGTGSATQESVKGYLGAHTDAEFTVSVKGSVYSIDSTPVAPGAK